MKLVEAPLPGAWIVELERLEDERGSFARTFDRLAFAACGLDAEVAEMSTSFNARRGTLRGMHFQAAPHGEAKLVRVTRGAIYDVIVDLRTRDWFAIELTASNDRALVVPPGVAHGFQTLADSTEVHYVMSTPYVASARRGVRWDDPAFGIAWPEAPGGRTMSERDATYADVPV